MQVRRKLCRNHSNSRGRTKFNPHKFQEQEEIWGGGLIIGQQGWAVGQRVWDRLLAARLEGEGEEQICRTTGNAAGRTSSSEQRSRVLVLSLIHTNSFRTRSSDPVLQLEASASGNSTPLSRSQASYTSCLGTDHGQSNKKDIFSELLVVLSVRTQSGSKNDTRYLNNAGASEVGHQKTSSPSANHTLASAGRKCCFQGEKAWDDSHPKGSKQPEASPVCLPQPSHLTLTTANGTDYQNRYKSRKVDWRVPAPASQSQIPKSRCGAKRQ